MSLSTMSLTALRNVAVALTIASLAQPAFAVAVSFEATDNATVQPAGPRTGANGKNFLNVEGSNNNTFASFGVAEFDFSTLTPLGGTVSAISGATLELTQSNAAFSLPGLISVYYTANNTVSIQPAVAPDPAAVLYQAGGVNGAASIDPVLSPTTLLGSGMYDTTGSVDSGKVNTVSLTITGSVLTGLINAVNSGSKLRLIITPDEPTTAATYAGFGNNTYPGPTLKFEATVGGGTFLPGDFDENNAVNGADLTTKWTPGFGTATGAAHMNGDANGDGAVNGADYLIWQQQFGTVPVIGSVPEPGALALALVALGCLTRFRRAAR
jgi:hypothetical protein